MGGLTPSKPPCHFLWGVRVCNRVFHCVCAAVFAAHTSYDLFKIKRTCPTPLKVKQAKTKATKEVGQNASK